MPSLPFHIQHVSVELPTGDAARSLPLRVTFPTNAPEPAPVILFSHGATGSRDGYVPLIRHWAANGYVCVQPTHGDSLYWYSREEKRQLTSLEDLVRDVRTAQHWRSRPCDITRVMDELPGIARMLPGEAPRFNYQRIGVGGHSFGAHTSQLVAGLTHVDKRTGQRASFRDDRPVAFVWISPQGNDEATDVASWTDCTRPTLVVTGTNDNSPRNGEPYTWRIEAFESLPPGDKYLLLIDEAHHGFGGIAGRLRYPGSGPMVPEQVATVEAATLAFWDAFLKQDATEWERLASGEVPWQASSARLEKR